MLASDLDNRWNDFPLHASFVPFLHEAVRYLGSARAHAVEYVVADAPAAAKRTPGVVDVPAERAGAAPRRLPSTSIRARRIRHGCRRTIFSRR